MMLARRIYLQNFIGLCNRLEALALAFALRAAHGHEIRLDWPELDWHQGQRCGFRIRTPFLPDGR